MIVTYFVHLPSLDTKLYTRYFLDTFIPERKFHENCTDFFIQYFRKDFSNNSVIMSLNNILQKKYKFPPIQYFSIIKHDSIQPVHHDGKEFTRHVSLNLPLQGFESTKMIFYKIILDIPPKKLREHQYLPGCVEPISELEGSNNWVLVNSGVPHSVINIDFNNPRITLCLRFVGNPTITQLIKKINAVT